MPIGELEFVTVFLALARDCSAIGNSSDPIYSAGAVEGRRFDVWLATAFWGDSATIWARGERCWNMVFRKSEGMEP